MTSIRLTKTVMRIPMPRIAEMAMMAERGILALAVSSEPDAWDATTCRPCRDEMGVERPTLAKKVRPRRYDMVRPTSRVVTS
jgi:hypothetical protein